MCNGGVFQARLYLGYISAISPGAMEECFKRAHEAIFKAIRNEDGVFQKARTFE